MGASQLGNTADSWSHRDAHGPKAQQLDPRRQSPGHLLILAVVRLAALTTAQPISQPPLDGGELYCAVPEAAIVRVGHEGPELARINAQQDRLHREEVLVRSRVGAHHNRWLDWFDRGAAAGSARGGEGGVKNVPVGDGDVLSVAQQ